MPEVPVELAEQGVDPLGGLRIEVAGGLVGQQQPRLEAQRPGQRHPLLLAAGELAGPVVEPVGQPHLRQHLLGAARASAAGQPPDQPGHHGVLERGELGQQVVALEDEADRLVAEAGQLLLVEGGQVAPLEEDPAGAWASRACPARGGRCSSPRPTGPVSATSSPAAISRVTSRSTSSRLPADEVGLAEPLDVEQGRRHHSLRRPSTGSSRAALVAG